MTSALRDWILFATVISAAGSAAAALAGYDVPQALLAVSVIMLALLAILAIARARRRTNESVLPTRSELSTLAFPPTGPTRRVDRR